MASHELATLRPLRDIVAEYDTKLAAIPALASEFDKTVQAAKIAACIGGEYGGDIFARGGTPSLSERSAAACLLQSAWKHIYAGLNIGRIASAADKSRFLRALEAPAPFTIDNIAATFGDYIQRPRHHILKGLAECFCDLDPAYKSHSKVKIGVAGLPKRVILSSVGGYGSYGRSRLIDMINALAAYRGEPLVEHVEFAQIDALSNVFAHKAGEVTLRGLKVRKFQNGNAHVIFDPTALLDINRALAEFYGDVLPDARDGGETTRRASTEVSKDLQFYPTPKVVIDRLIKDLGDIRGKRILEPSCGDGRIMDGLRAAGALTYGIEVGVSRAMAARAMGHPVHVANFLQVIPAPMYPGDTDTRADLIVMNPPFYGRHWSKHVNHATKFLKPGGALVAILPITAREDDGLLGPKWATVHGMKISTYHGRDGFHDLPVGSFSESGTNINTTIFTAFKE